MFEMCEKVAVALKVTLSLPDWRRKTSFWLHRRWAQKQMAFAKGRVKRPVRVGVRRLSPRIPCCDFTGADLVGFSQSAETLRLEAPHQQGCTYRLMRSSSPPMREEPATSEKTHAFRRQDLGQFRLLLVVRPAKDTIRPPIFASWIASCYCFPCTLPQKPATVTEKKSQFGHLG